MVCPVSGVHVHVRFVEASLHGEGVLRVGFDLHAVAEIECVSFAVGAVVCRGTWM